MNTKRSILIFGGITLVSALFAVSLRVEAQTGSVNQAARALSPERTQCDVSLPITVDMVPLNQPQVGQEAMFQVVVESKIDPDLVESMQVEYELPEGVRLAPETSSTPTILAKSGSNRLEMKVIIPDEARYPIRARLAVHLTNGKAISQTAVSWVDLGAEDEPEGMIGRIVEPDGTGIRVYQGQAVQ